MKNIANTKQGSKHNRALAFLKTNRDRWFTPREIEDRLNIRYPNLARRFREDYCRGIIFGRKDNGFVKYKNGERI